MQKLVQGVHFFQNVGFSRHQKLFQRLGDGQKPQACFITCCDSRIDPNLITNSLPGELFIVRNVGNIVPCFGTSNNGELAAVEYAVQVLGVEDVIVCGHTRCGAMDALLKGKAPALVGQWLQHAEATRVIMQEQYSALEGDELLTATAEENVLVQLEHLRTLPAIASRVSQGKVHLHGWMYKITTGEIFVYDSEVGQFLPMAQSTAQNAPGEAVAATETGSSAQPSATK